MPPRILSQLPVEIIQSEVLARLPAKSIGRFRCVCKAWNSFLSTLYFSRTHSHYNTNHKLLLLLNSPTRTFSTLDYHDSVTTRFRLLPFKDDVLILASLDGLVCVALMKTRVLAFWNPLTGAYKKFHTSFFDDIRNGAFALYIDSSNDYRLVHIVSVGAFIYSRRLDSWRKIINPSLEISHYISNFKWFMATFSGDKVYFKLKTRRENPLRVISFDVESEKFMEIQLPPPPVPCDARLGEHLVALDGYIHLCVGFLDISWNVKCDMWRMVDDGWIKVAAFSNTLGKQYKFREIHTRRNGSWFAVWKDNNSVKNYGLEDLVKDFFYFIWEDFSDNKKEAVYNETLVSPNP
ncbi:putative F-box domain-containing protein [Helianthus debilis subsp. tardiflorus]